MKRAIVFAASGVVRAGIRTVLENSGQFEIVASAASPEVLGQVLSPVDHDVLVSAASDAELDELAPLLESASAAVILANGDLSPWMQHGLGLGGFAVLEASASPEEVVSAAVAASTGLFVSHADRLSFLSVREPLATEPSTADRLTPRETEVLGMMAEGLGNKTIAYRLGISDHTVKFHVGSILRKLDAESRTEAVTRGIRQGYITV